MVISGTQWEMWPTALSAFNTGWQCVLAHRNGSLHRNGRGSWKQITYWMNSLLSPHAGISPTFEICQSCLIWNLQVFWNVVFWNATLHFCPSQLSLICLQPGSLLFVPPQPSCGPPRELAVCAPSALPWAAQGACCLCPLSPPVGCPALDARTTC